MSFKRISIDEAKTLIDTADITVADVRDAGAFQAGHIANSVHLSDDNVEEFVANGDKEKPLIVYCYHGNASQGAGNYFDSQGFGEVYSIDGGFEAWRQKY
jgi:thiosulfate sulfurtransferase